jgi:4-carboxymuconolactone decarboxylase
MHARRPGEVRLQPVEKVRRLIEERVAKTGSPMRAFNVGATMANHRGMQKVVGTFTSDLLGSLTVDPRHREIVILRTGWDCGSEYEFGQHTLAAREAGLTDDEILGLTRPIHLGNWTPAECSLMQMVDDLYADDCVSDSSWAEVHTHFDSNTVTEFMVLCLSYRLVSGLLNTWGTELDDGVPGWPLASPG